MAKGWEVVVGLCGVEEGEESEGGYRRLRDQQEGREGSRAREREEEREAASCGYEYDRGRGPSIRHAKPCADIRAEKIEYPVGEEQLFQLNLPAICE
jgi:hypothetical protein